MAIPALSINTPARVMNTPAPVAPLHSYASIGDGGTNVGEIETWLGCSLPSEYREFLETCDVELKASDVVLLYRRSTLIERNETHQTKEYCPGFVTIGN